MRKIIVLTFISLDGVMQAPGGPEEDTSGNFKYGGWTFPYFDEVMAEVMEKQMTPPFDLLLGRITYDIFASYWPEHADQWPGINEAAKICSLTRTYGINLGELGSIEGKCCGGDKRAESRGWT